MKSAIELYKEAYELDFRSGDWEGAEELYKRIIEKYPHSTEKEYAQLHLGRINNLKNAGGEEEPLKPTRTIVRSGPGSVLGIIAFILMLLLAASSPFLYYLYKEQNNKMNSQEWTIMGLYYQNLGKDKMAKKAFGQAYRIYPGNTAAYKMMNAKPIRSETSANEAELE